MAKSKQVHQLDLDPPKHPDLQQVALSRLKRNKSPDKNGTALSVQEKLNPPTALSSDDELSPDWR
ncbi:MAG: hypothetical protein ACK553_15985 [Planctomycetota bacterium]|jgi:hypothetical protein